MCHIIRHLFLPQNMSSNGRGPLRIMSYSVISYELIGHIRTSWLTFTIGLSQTDLSCNGCIIGHHFRYSPSPSLYRTTHRGIYNFLPRLLRGHPPHSIFDIENIICSPSPAFSAGTRQPFPLAGRCLYSLRM